MKGVEDKTMDNVDFEYVRMRSAELLAHINEDETTDVTAEGTAAAKSDSVTPQRFAVWRRVYRAIQMRRRSIRILSDATR